MIELWGSDACPSCKQAVMLISKIPIEWKYVDVAVTNFEGEIPRLILEDGTHIVGLGPINNYLKEWKKRMGF